MDNKVTSTSLIGKYQRISLLVFGILLTAFLFIQKGGLNANSPLDQLARNSLNPQEALLNGKPTLIEFYADWCEVCRGMAPDMLSIKNKYKSQIDVVLINIENPQWNDLIEAFDVNGVPQIDFFDKSGNILGESIGKREENEIIEIINSILNETEINQFNGINLIDDNKQISSSINSGIYSENNTISPRSHF